MALGFLRGPDRPPRTILDALLQLIMDVQQWAAKQSTAGMNDIKLRVGVHTGSVIVQQRDINGQPNLVGSAINEAQRVMDAANPSQVLMSERAVSWLLGTPPRKITFPFPCTLGDEVQISVKHDIAISVMPLELDDKREYWDNSPIQKRWNLSLRLTDKPWADARHLDSRWITSKRIVMIAVSGAVFRRCRVRIQREYFKYDGRAERGDEDAVKPIGLMPFEAEINGPNIFSKDLQELRVFIPTEDMFNIWNSANKPIVVEQYDNVRKFWERFLEKLATEYEEILSKQEQTLGIRLPRPTIELMEYIQFGYLAYYFDWKQPGGLIRASQYAWGVEAREIPGFEVEWKGKPCPPAFSEYVQGLDNLQNLKLEGYDQADFLSKRIWPPPV